MKYFFSVKTLLFSAFLVLASCTSVERATSPAVTARAPVIQENLGEQVARHLTSRYADTRSDCGKPSMPSFLCSGVMLRGTSSDPKYHVWDNSPASINKGGVSFSYLRADTDFKKLAYSYNNGYIFESYVHAGDKIHPEILCSFPIDAATSHRSDAGCGMYPGYAGSGPCHLKGVTTSGQWWEDYTSHPTDRRIRQCGFDVRNSRNELGGPAFAASVGARADLGAEGYETQNEIILKTWDDNLGRVLPLEAFFYIGAAGLPVAQRNQRDLRATDGILIPIISVRLAPTQDGRATFYYIASDQTEPMPVAP